MRHILLAITAFIACGTLAGLACQTAVAAPLPQVATSAPGASSVEPAGYWRYNDCTGPNVVVVPTAPTAPVVVPAVPADPAAPVAVPGSPPGIAVVPVRPTSCGEFRYWNGTACVDARYNTPYLGPR
jgi:hypothetical protein